MKPHTGLTHAAASHPRLTILLTVLLLLGTGALLPRIQIDTDPENMLPADQPDRVFHNLVKQEFSLYDMIVVGIVNEEHENGVFNTQSLARILELTRHIETIDGVIRQDVLSLASVDNVQQDGAGTVRFQWLMSTPPATEQEALAIREAAQRLPTVNGTLISEDARAAAIYVPIVEKNQSHRIAADIEAFVAQWDGGDTFLLTGLPVAEDTFGIEMFKQMGIAAPLAALIIFLLMFAFFRSLTLITAPMILAIVTVVATMGLLIGFGFPVHIMSSMIPIFLMPIAVVDSIHILSEFADLYPKVGDRKETIARVLGHLFQPMLYTSLTSAAGFASLALAPIPPVRVFGVFVAFGILLAFLLTITFIPAYVVLMNDKSIAKLARPATAAQNANWLVRLLQAVGPRTITGSRWILLATLLISAFSAYGLTKIQINDNPVRWFRGSHRIRVADRILNEHFAGTYNAFLVLRHVNEDVHQACDVAGNALVAEDPQLQSQWTQIHEQTLGLADVEHINVLLERLEERADDSDAWTVAIDVLEEAQIRSKTFQDPEILRYVANLQQALLRTNLVGKSSSVVDITKTLHRELREGKSEFFSIPASSRAVAQTLLSYQSSHRPDDLWHFVTPDYRAANLWVQLKSGDNKDMAAVTHQVDEYLATNPLPKGVTLDWGGLTYLNVVWQDKMVSGMANALWGSFVIVFVMMLVLFRSLWFGMLAMLPLSATILLVYGLIGWVGKDYDMPMAVLSSLTLGLSVDFAIHFLQRARDLFAETGNWTDTVKRLFAEPARAISRNAIVVAVGFLPLLASPLVPYNSVGIFLAAIMLISSVVTLLLLPAIMSLSLRRLFRSTQISTTLLLVAASTLAAISFTAADRALAETPTAQEIVEKANKVAYYAGDDGRAEVRMSITDSQDRKRRRQFTILRKDIEDGGEQDYAVLFSHPADVRNTVFLVKKKPQGTDDRWLYLPDLDLVKRIAAGDKRTSFVGSHFFYEDISGRSLEEDSHELVETTEDNYVVRNTPRDAGSVEFAYWLAYINKNDFLPRRMEYFDESDKLYRRLEAVQVEVIAGHPTMVVMRVDDVRSGGFTIAEFRNVEYDLGIPESVFTERTLRNPSRQWFESQ